MNLFRQDFLFPTSSDSKHSFLGEFPFSFFFFFLFLFKRKTIFADLTPKKKCWPSDESGNKKSCWNKIYNSTITVVGFSSIYVSDISAQYVRFFIYILKGIYNNNSHILSTPIELYEISNTFYIWIFHTHSLPDTYWI